MNSFAKEQKIHHRGTEAQRYRERQIKSLAADERRSTQKIYSLIAGCLGAEC